MNQFISLAEAIQMTSNFRTNREEILKRNYQNKDILPLSETFDRRELDTVLSQQGCKGIRVYYGMDEQLKVHAIIVGVDENNRDMIPGSANVTGEEEEDDQIIERGIRCPPICPEESELNP